MKNKKYHLKKSVKIGLIGAVVLIISIFALIKINDNKKYKESNEYKLLQLGYTESDMNTLVEKLTDKQIRDLLKEEKNNSIIKIITSKYYLSKNYDEYLEYRKENYQNEISTTISLINTHANKSWYSDILEANQSKQELMLVNKFYKLNNYIVNDLEKIPVAYAYDNNQLRSIAAKAFVSMASAAKEQNITLIANGGYRTNESQEKTYNNLVNTNNTAYADKVSARPGHSEHETGYALDISTKGATKFVDSEAFTWLQANAYRYGFILRYPEGKENITGFSYEPWHYRYVGLKAAGVINSENITFDEYYAYYIEN